MRKYRTFKLEGGDYVERRGKILEEYRVAINRLTADRDTFLKFAEAMRERKVDTVKEILTEVVPAEVFPPICRLLCQWICGVYCWLDCRLVCM